MEQQDISSLDNNKDIQRIVELLKQNHSNIKIESYLAQTKSLIDDCNSHTFVFKGQDTNLKQISYLNVIIVNESTEVIINEIIELYNRKLELFDYSCFLKIFDQFYLQNEDQSKAYYVIQSQEYFFEEYANFQIETAIVPLISDFIATIYKKFKHSNELFVNWKFKFLKQNLYLTKNDSNNMALFPVINLLTNIWQKKNVGQNNEVKHEILNQQNGQKLQHLLDKYKILEIGKTYLLIPFSSFLSHVEKFYLNYYQNNQSFFKHIASQSKFKYFQIIEIADDTLAIYIKEYYQYFLYKYEKLESFINKKMKQDKEELLTIIDQKLFSICSYNLINVQDDLKYILFKEENQGRSKKNRAFSLLIQSSDSYFYFNLLIQMIQKLIELNQYELDIYCDVRNIKLQNDNISIPNPFFNSRNREEENKKFIVSVLEKMIQDNIYIKSQPFIQKTLQEQIEHIITSQSSEQNQGLFQQKTYYMQDLIPYLRKLMFIHYNFYPANIFKMNSKWQISLNYQTYTLNDDSIKYVEKLHINLKQMKEYSQQIISLVKQNQNLISLGLSNIPKKSAFLQVIKELYRLKSIKLNYQYNNCEYIYLKDVPFLFNLESIKFDNTSRFEASIAEYDLDSIMFNILHYYDLQESLQKISNLKKLKINLDQVLVSKPDDLSLDSLITELIKLKPQIYNQILSFKSSQSNINTTKQNSLQDQSKKDQSNIFNNDVSSAFSNNLFDKSQNNLFNSKQTNPFQKSENNVQITPSNNLFTQPQINTNDLFNKPANNLFTQPQINTNDLFNKPANNLFNNLSNDLFQTNQNNLFSRPQNNLFSQQSDQFSLQRNNNGADTNNNEQQPNQINFKIEDSIRQIDYIANIKQFFSLNEDQISKERHEILLENLDEIKNKYQNLSIISKFKCFEKNILILEFNDIKQKQYDILKFELKFINEQIEILIDCRCKEKLYCCLGMLEIYDLNVNIIQSWIQSEQSALVHQFLVGPQETLVCCHQEYNKLHTQLYKNQRHLSNLQIGVMLCNEIIKRQNFSFEFNKYQIVNLSELSLVFKNQIAYNNSKIKIIYQELEKLNFLHKLRIIASHTQLNQQQQEISSQFNKLKKLKRLVIYKYK